MFFISRVHPFVRLLFHKMREFLFKLDIADDIPFHLVEEHLSSLQHFVDITCLQICLSLLPSQPLSQNCFKLPLLPFNFNG